jgi:hypothetical protein
MGRSGNAEFVPDNYDESQIPVVKKAIIPSFTLIFAPKVDRLLEFVHVPQP